MRLRARRPEGLSDIVKLPFYDLPTNPRFKLGQNSVHTMKIIDFLRYVVKRDELSIAEYLSVMGQDPFFLVAATGLGKTVAVPVHVLIRLMQSIGARPRPSLAPIEPRVWVIEPRIPIAIDQMKFMNSLWAEYLVSKKEAKLPPLFGCITSASGNVNRNAPIKFVTTGIFELMSKADELSPSRDRVIIDEAHVTIEQNPGVELGIALTRAAGVTIDYMSATVDTTTLATDLGATNIIRADRQRHVVWKHNLLQPLHETLPSLIKSTLVEQDLSSDYYPQLGGFGSAAEVRSAASEPNRSHGLLAVVNSFAGDHSDIRRLADIIHRSFPTLPVLELASEVVRDARRSQEFKRRFDAIETQHQNYVILATSVVEMGITFPTLDYVVTMDSGYNQETIGDVSFPVTAPLGVNSLLQRIGRVGRRRPGIAYISNEVGADYAELDDHSLNQGGLQYEAIRFPMSSAPLISLAFYACKQTWSDLTDWVGTLKLPSRLHENSDRMMYLAEQIEMLHSLNVAENNRLTPFGETMEQWIGQADLAYSVQLQRRLIEGAELPELIFWIVTTALSSTPIVTLRAQHDFFVDYQGVHAEIAHDLNIWGGHEHEDLIAFFAVGLAAMLTPRTVFPRQVDQIDKWDEAEFARWCTLSGLDGRKLRRAGRAVSDIWRLFAKVNSRDDRFKQLFGGETPLSLETIDWRATMASVPRSDLVHQLTSLSGTAEISIIENDAGTLEWRDVRSDHSGIASQDDTPIRLQPGPYTARPVPSRSAKSDVATWRLAHLGPVARRTETAMPTGWDYQEVVGPLPTKKGRWRRFLERIAGQTSGDEE